MGKRSLKLVGKEAAVRALFKYLERQSGKSSIELERQFIPSYQTQTKHRDLDAAPGKQWSRWSDGPIVPSIQTVKKLFDFCVNQLISGGWKETGQESIWAGLVEAVCDQKVLLLAKHRIALVIAYRRLQAPNIITDTKIRGIEVGYYLPPSEEIEKLFFVSVNVDHRNALVGNQRCITVKNDYEENAVRSMLKEIETTFGENTKDISKLAGFRNRWKLPEGEADWSDQLLSRMHEDAKILSEMADRYHLLGGGITNALIETRVGERITEARQQLQDRLDQISMMNPHQRIAWKNEFYFFIVKAQELDKPVEARYLSVVEARETDHYGRNLRELNPLLFRPIQG